MTPTFPSTLLAGFLFVVTLLPDAKAQILFSDDFDSGLSSLDWLENLSGGDGEADFAFDYSALGIPAAPNSSGTTIGLGFTVNRDASVFSGLSVSPAGMSFDGDFEIAFDLWMNFIGPFPAGGSGTTQFASFGWGTSGSTPQWAAANHSIIFSTSLDGGAAADYRVYGAAGGAPLLPDTGVYAAGTLAAPDPDSRNNPDPYYAGFGGEAAPDAQLALYPGQTGTTVVGSLGMRWRAVVIRKSNNVLSWLVDGLLIASVPLNSFTLGGENLFLGMFDSNAISSSDPNDFLNAAIFDNLVVTRIEGVNVVAVANPQVAPGEFSFDVLGPNGAMVDVEASDNLIDWEAIETITLGAAPYHYTAPRAETEPAFYYRARPQ